MSQKITMKVQGNKSPELNIKSNGSISFSMNRGAGTSNYDALSNKPKLNGRAIQGDRLAEYYDVQDKLSWSDKHDIDRIFFGI